MFKSAFFSFLEFFY